MSQQILDEPIRAAVFDDVRQAQHVVEELQRAGFDQEHITVVCSDRNVEKQFRPYEHQEPAGFYTPAALWKGAIAGAWLVSSIAVALVLATRADTFLLTIGVFSALFGGVAGGFVAAMMTRAREKELANFYDQDVRRGEILVAAEDHSDHAAQSLSQAEHILEDAGAKPLRLPEG